MTLARRGHNFMSHCRHRIIFVNVPYTLSTTVNTPCLVNNTPCLVNTPTDHLESALNFLCLLFTSKLIISFQEILISDSKYQRPNTGCRTYNYTGCRTFFSSMIISIIWFFSPKTPSYCDRKSTKKDSFSVKLSSGVGKCW